MNKETLSDSITSSMLEEKGQALYKKGKLFMLIGKCGFALFLALVLGALLIYGEYGLINLLNFDLPTGYEIFLILLVLSYIAILLGLSGIVMYFNGLNLFGLGRIAVNTEKE